MTVVTVDFVGADLSDVEVRAQERGYHIEGGENTLVDYVRDCALGKFEPDKESTAGTHIETALLIFEIARSAYVEAHGSGSGLTFFLDRLKEELVVAAENERLG